MSRLAIATLAAAFALALSAPAQQAAARAFAPGGAEITAPVDQAATQTKKKKKKAAAKKKKPSSQTAKKKKSPSKV